VEYITCPKCGWESAEACAHLAHDETRTYLQCPNCAEFLKEIDLGWDETQLPGASGDE
jgi:predicted RNA-binding Zn-ribbon protein involved in translation (DUF1610 family)